MAGKVRTYSSKEVLISFGTHAVSGYAEDSFVNLEKNGDGWSRVTGADGETIRSQDPDDTWNVTLTLLQESVTNAWLNNKLAQDENNKDGMFPVTVKDLRGGALFSCEQAWVTKSPSYGFGKTAQNREWTLNTGAGTLRDSKDWK
jgi:hypothetical protein